MTVELVHANIINIIAPTVITDNGLIVAICTHPTIAQRLAQLWDRHGATDVPDNAAGVGE